MRLSLSQKLLARAGGARSVEPGETLLARVDVLMTHDVCGPGTIGVFEREFGPQARVWDPERVVLIPDHYIFTSDERANRNVDTLREFARRQGIRHFHDVVDGADRWRFDAQRPAERAQHGPGYAGVCHVALAEKGHTRPGELLLGTDSHTCTAGAFGTFATGIGNTDAAFVLGTGRILLRVPEALRVVLDGALPAGVMAKDAILHLIGRIGFDGATYRALEFTGPGCRGLSVEERMTIANMAIECGAKNGIFEADDVTRAFVDAAGRAHGTSRPYEILHADRDADYAAELPVNLSGLEPTVALHPDPGNLAPARDCGEIGLERAYIGSCTGGKYTDFEASAHILRGRRVAIETVGVPATPEVVRRLKQSCNGQPSLWDVLVAAGVRMTENASCAACLGGPADTFGRLNSPARCISTTNRNFPGRMGHPQSRVYLASPCTVAASAVAGRIVDPRDYLQ